MNAILRLPTVKGRTGLSRSTIYLRVADGSFPRPVSIGSRAIGWLESDIEAWIMHRAQRTISRHTAAQKETER
jgi:prophage regulatory protein